MEFIRTQEQREYRKRIENLAVERQKSPLRVSKTFLYVGFLKQA